MGGISFQSLQLQALWILSLLLEVMNASIKGHYKDLNSKLQLQVTLCMSSGQGIVKTASKAKKKILSVPEYIL